MKRIFTWLTLATLAISLSSCGLPGALVRTAGNTINSVSNLAGSALGN